MTALLPPLAHAANAQDAASRLFNADHYTLVAEVERERSADRSETGNGLTFYPGLRWRDGIVHQLELRIATQWERDRSTSPAGESMVRDLGIRVRRNIDWGHPTLGGFVRALIGQKRSEGQSRELAYVEPALTWQSGRLEWYGGYRVIRSLGNNSTDNRDQLRLGMGYPVNESQEVEFRVARAWASANRNRVNDAVEVEWTWKF